MVCLGWNLHNGRKRPIIWPGMNRRGSASSCAVFGCSGSQELCLWPVAVQSNISKGSILFKTHIFKSNWGQTEKESEIKLILDRWWFWKMNRGLIWWKILSLPILEPKVTLRHGWMTTTHSIIMPTQAVRCLPRKIKRQSFTISI